MGTTNFPMNFVNRNGIPLIESASIEVTTDNVIITIADRSFRWLNQKGVILFRLNQAIPSSGDALTVMMESNGFTQPVTLIGGGNAVGTDFTGVGVYLVYYDKDSNLMQLLNV